MHTLGWSLQLDNITLSFDVKSESIFYGKTRIKCDFEQNYCPLNHAIKATVIWEPDHYCSIFDVGRLYAHEIKFQKRYFIDVLENNETNFGHKRSAHMYTSRFQKHLYDESVLSLFEVLAIPLYKCNDDRPYYATENQEILVQYREGLNFVTGKGSAEFKDVHLTIPNGAPSTAP